MKPEKWDTGPNKEEYLALNIPENWIQPLYESGFTSSTNFRSKTYSCSPKIKWVSKKKQARYPCNTTRRGTILV